MVVVQLLMPGGKGEAKNLAIQSDSCISTLSNGPGEEKPVQNFLWRQAGLLSWADVHLRDAINIWMLHLLSMMLHLMI